MQSSIDAAPILLMLAGALGLSLVVERVVEFAKNITDLLPTRAFGAATFKAHELDKDYDEVIARIEIMRRRRRVIEAQKLVDELDEKIRQEPVGSTQLAKLKIERDAAAGDLNAAIAMAPLTEGEIEEGAPVDTLLVHPATDPDLAGAARKFVLIMLSFAVGIVAAKVAHIELFNGFLTALGRSVPESVDHILTGLFIGGGSGPVHTLIRFITERKYAPAPAAVEETAASVPSPALSSAAPPPISPKPIDSSGGGVAVITKPSVWVDIPYDGGVDVQVLESTHRRSGPPNKIVYHHTAMHLNSSFADVVRVIKSRKAANGKNWITGYHCVVTSDGVAHPFCRWDRYGNHALGHNDRSLGISLNGNFETVERSKWSNYNGAYGPPRPTDQQLRAAARVVALWCTIYHIPADFENHIVPHFKVSPKSCPGNNFPYAEFEHLVKEYHSTWQQSEAATSAIRAFATKKYLGRVYV